MNNNEVLLFIGKCLTLKFYPERIEEIRKTIISGNVPWEKVVWISSKQYVLTALYVHLRDSDLLTELPPDLTEHFEYLYSLNYKRNNNILLQAQEITELLNEYNIEPIFLKGTANLLSNLYGDIGERIVGDIDLLVNEGKMLQAAEILKENGYYEFAIHPRQSLQKLKHYPRLGHSTREASVEVHRQIMHQQYEKSFGFDEITQDKVKTEIEHMAFIPSLNHRIIHNIVHQQINNKANFWGIFSMRQSYDLLLFSLKTDVYKVAIDFGKFYKYFNNYLGVTSILFNNPRHIQYNYKQAKLYLFRTSSFYKYPKIYLINYLILYVWLRLYRYFNLFVTFFYKKSVRNEVLWKVKSWSWIKKHIASYRNIFK